MQGQPKRNTPIVQAEATSRLRPNGRNRAPRRLVQAEPGTRHRSSRGCLERSTALASSGRSGRLASNHLLANPGAPSSMRCEYVFLGLGPQRSRGAGSPGTAPDRIFRVVKNGNKSLPRRQFASAIEVACERPISRFARLWGFVIRSPSRPMGVRLFLGSSAVEHSTVNRMVAGSNPARGARHFCERRKLLRAMRRRMRLQFRSSWCCQFFTARTPPGRLR